MLVSAHADESVLAVPSCRFFCGVVMKLRYSLQGSAFHPGEGHRIPQVWGVVPSELRELSRPPTPKSCQPKSSDPRRLGKVLKCCCSFFPVTGRPCTQGKSDSHLDPKP